MFFWSSFTFQFLLNILIFIRFCGWVDVGLSEVGKNEAENAAKAIQDSGIDVTKIFTSLLTRANLTVDKILERVDVSKDNVHKVWRLNERHYGALTGLNKGKGLRF